MIGLRTQTGPFPPPFFCKYVIRKDFKSFVLKVCETKGVADVFLRNCVNLKSLGGILASLRFVGPFTSLYGLSSDLKRALG